MKTKFWLIILTLLVSVQIGLTGAAIFRLTTITANRPTVYWAEPTTPTPTLINKNSRLLALFSIKTGSQFELHWKINRREQILGFHLYQVSANNNEKARLTEALVLQADQNDYQYSVPEPELSGTFQLEVVLTTGETENYPFPRPANP